MQTLRPESQNLHFHKIPRWVSSTVKLKKPGPRWPWLTWTCTYACSAGIRSSPFDSGYTAAQWHGAGMGTARPLGCSDGQWPRRGGTHKAVHHHGKGPPGTWQNPYRIQRLSGGCGNKNSWWDPGRRAQKRSQPSSSHMPHQAVFWGRGSGVREEVRENPTPGLTEGASHASSHPHPLQDTSQDGGWELSVAGIKGWKFTYRMSCMVCGLYLNKAVIEIYLQKRVEKRWNMSQRKRGFVYQERDTPWNSGKRRSGELGKSQVWMDMKQRPGWRVRKEIYKGHNFSTARAANSG